MHSCAVVRVPVPSPGIVYTEYTPFGFAICVLSSFFVLLILFLLMRLCYFVVCFLFGFKIVVGVGFMLHPVFGAFKASA